jgi:protein subunit release factor A
MNEILKDLRINVFSNSSPQIVMRILHIPTGLIVEGEDTERHRLQKRLLNEISSKVEEFNVKWLGKK